MLPVVLRAPDDFALAVFEGEGRLAFAVALNVILTSFFGWLALVVEEVVLAGALGALRLVVDQVVAQAIGVLGVAVSVSKQVTGLALGTSVAVVLCAELDCADVVGEGERGQAVQAPLLVVLLAPVDLALSVDCQFERSSALETLLAVVLKAAEDDLDAGIVAPLVALGTAGALVVSLRDAALAGQSQSLSALHAFPVDLSLIHI